MDEEQLVEKEQPTARPRLEYEEGFKRIYIVLVVCWVALLSLMFPIKAILQAARLDQSFSAGFLGILVIPPDLGYVLFVPSCSLAA